MKHRFDPIKILESAIGTRGIPFPGMFYGERNTASEQMQEFTPKGSRLYKKDALGRWYFMPVHIGDIEIPQAVLSITSKKNIIETSMIGRRGTVKELISIDDYRISLGLYIQSSDGAYPEEQINEIQELWEINQSVAIHSALTDIILYPDNKIVISSISYPSTPGVEDAQLVKLECVTDAPFELIIE